MDCYKSAKESNITYFMAGETRLKNTTNGTHNRLVHQETLKHLVKPGQPTCQTFAQRTGQAFGQPGEFGPMVECSFSN